MQRIDLNKMLERIDQLEANSHSPVDWDKTIAKLIHRINELELCMEDLKNECKAIRENTSK